jgi:L-threonylcarbamoyladenylate synthase
MKISLDQAEELLISGSVVALPTETVYGLAALFTLPHAIEKIYALKGRPRQNPLIVHVNDPYLVRFYTKEVPLEAETLMTAFWPGPLTLVLPANIEKVPDIVRSGKSTVAFRVPSHPIISSILKNVGPIVAPSANLSGKPSATTLKHVEDDFGLNFPVVDGGEIEKGVESTILVYTEGVWKIGRLGSISPEDFAPHLGYIPKNYEKASIDPICPGSLYRHYSPNAKLYLGSLEKCIDSVVLGYTDRFYPNASLTIPIGESTNPYSIMKNLYSSLRKLDEMGISEAFIDIDFPMDGLYLTIYERFFRAADIQVK